MKIGYIRVSTQEQNTIRQEVMMQTLGVDELYIDRASGKNAQRPELQKMMEYVRRGDTVIVESISRFARNTRGSLRVGGAADCQGCGVRLTEGVYRYDHTDRKIYAHHLWCCGGAGAGVHPAAPARRYRNCQTEGEVCWPQTNFPSGL